MILLPYQESLNKPILIYRFIQKYFEGRTNESSVKGESNA